MLTRSRSRGAAALGKVIRELYEAGQTDYSLEPIVLADDQGNPLGRIQDRDAVIFCCRRGERETQLTEAFTDPVFDRFPRKPLRDLHFVPLTLYHEKFKDLPVAFAPTRIQDTLAGLISRAGLRQLHTAESEKFAHVTFFFNGGSNQPFEGEQDICVPSPRHIPFDQIPELSLPQVAEQVCLGVAGKYDFIIVNFANGDVIGHTANREAKIRCASLVDSRLDQVVRAALAQDLVVMVTADHGNLEVMTKPDGSPHVAHTANRVRFILMDPRSPSVQLLPEGRLADVAPTILSAFGLDQPPAMDGTNLAPGHKWGGRRRVLLIILDGWGIGAEDDTNPIFLAETPHWDDLNRQCAGCCLQAAGEAVGLQPGKAGNSEAGHMNLGAGRVVLQDDVRLDRAMQDDSFYRNDVLLLALDQVKQRNSRLHLLGLLSEKSSHGTIEYPLALLRMARRIGLNEVYVHLIFDGRSTEPGSAPVLLEQFEQKMDEVGIGQIVSGIGRGIALDRNGNYEKTRCAFDALVMGTGRRASVASAANADQDELKWISKPSKT